MGMGSHFILVFFRAEFSRDLNDSFLWNCWSKHGLEDEKWRDGSETRVCADRKQRARMIC